MKLRITIELGSDALSGGDAGLEVARILRRAADNVEGASEQGMMRGYSEAMPLRDVNGNRCGSVKAVRG